MTKTIRLPIEFRGTKPRAVWRYGAIGSLGLCRRFAPLSVSLPFRLIFRLIIKWDVRVGG